MEVDSFIRIGHGFDSLYHFDVKYNFTYKDKEYIGYLYYFGNNCEINENNKNLMGHMFSVVLRHIKDHHNLKTKKGEQLGIGVNFEKKGTLGFKEIEDEFLSKLPIYDNCLKWC